LSHELGAVSAACVDFFGALTLVDWELILTLDEELLTLPQSQERLNSETVIQLRFSGFYVVSVDFVDYRSVFCKVKIARLELNVFSFLQSPDSLSN
jgi:hypothetical protein